MHHKQIELWVLYMRISVTFNFRQLLAIANLNSIHSLYLVGFFSLTEAIKFVIFVCTVYACVLYTEINLICKKKMLFRGEGGVGGTH